MTSVPSIALNDGISLPAIGLGTVHSDDAARTVRDALASGYRLIDTALRYENEEGVGQGIVESGIPRGDVLVTTKIPGRHHGYDEAKRSVDQSRKNLGLDRIDLVLIHWPLPRLDKYVDTWRAMIDMQRSGIITSIGVSNFTAEHLKRIAGETGVLPVVNQIEMHPYFPQATLRAFHADHGIVTESWSPLGRGSELLGRAPVVDAAAAHDVSPAQVVLRWHVQLGAIPLPKSSDAGRQRENLDVFGFELSSTEVELISGMERGRIWDQDPDVHEEF